MTAAPRISAERVKEKTGKSYDEWFRVLDAWGAKSRDHTSIARHLTDDLEVPGWWAQTVTVEYERARGLRDVGQRRDGGFEASVQRTIPAAPVAVKRAFTELDAVNGWLKDAKLKRAYAKAIGSLRLSRTAQGQMIRADLPATRGATHKLEITLAPKGKDATVVTVVHSRLASAEEREDVKTRWRKALDALKAFVAA